jgi:hypothetical protein
MLIAAYHHAASRLTSQKQVSLRPAGAHDDRILLPVVRRLRQNPHRRDARLMGR